MLFVGCGIHACPPLTGHTPARHFLTVQASIDEDACIRGIAWQSGEHDVARMMCTCRVTCRLDGLDNALTHF